MQPTAMNPRPRSAGFRNEPGGLWALCLLATVSCAASGPGPNPRVASEGSICARAVPVAADSEEVVRAERQRARTAARIDPAARAGARREPLGALPRATYGSPQYVNEPMYNGPGFAFTTMDIAPGPTASCAVLTDRSVRCWGSNQHLQLGSGLSGCPFPTELPGVHDAARVVVGSGHACARLIDGMVWCWGGNQYGQIGDPSEFRAPVWLPAPVPGLDHVTGIAAGEAHTCARRNNGSVWCWGANRFGQVGDSTTQDRPTPVQIPQLAHVVQIAAGGRDTCARLVNGTVQCWGENAHGQMCDRTGRDHVCPVVLPGLTDVIEVDVGGGHGCARRTDATIRCWGWNAFGQLGDGTETDRATPADVIGLVNVAEVALGGKHSCARLLDGSVRCWGSNEFGQLGDGTISRSRTTPIAVVGLTDAASLRLGPTESCARTRDGTTWCWGANSSGQLGDGTRVNRTVPTRVAW